jgi:hypothetical protein
MVLVIGSIPLNHLEGSGPDHPGRVLISSEAAAPTRTGEQMATRTRADTRPSFSGMTHTPNLAFLHRDRPMRQLQHAPAAAPANRAAEWISDQLCCTA